MWQSPSGGTRGGTSPHVVAARWPGRAGQRAVCRLSSETGLVARHSAARCESRTPTRLLGSLADETGVAGDRECGQAPYGSLHDPQQNGEHLT